MIIAGIKKKLQFLTFTSYRTCCCIRRKVLNWRKWYVISYLSFARLSLLYPWEAPCHRRLPTRGRSRNLYLHWILTPIKGWAICSTQLSWNSVFLFLQEFETFPFVFKSNTSRDLSYTVHELVVYTHFAPWHYYDCIYPNVSFPNKRINK